MSRSCLCPSRFIAETRRSGKSTLLLTLLRILELQSGTIKLDGVDISRVPLEILRERCFVTASQDTLFLSNETLRFNLDPDASLPNEIITAALEKTGLWKHFLRADPTNSDPEHINQVLDKKLSLLPELSVGQCQLFGFCRALVKISSAEYAGRKPVILLDEVTSSLDPVTESKIYEIVDEEFTGRGYTVFAIAHRVSVLSGDVGEGKDVVAEMVDGRVKGR